MLSEIYQIIILFVLLHPILSVYFMGSLTSIGIVYSLISYGYLNPINKKRMFIEAIVGGWIVVIVFLYGFFKFIFTKNDKEE